MAWSAELAAQDGARVPVQVGAVSCRDGGGLRVQIVMHDMTELRVKEAASQEQFRFIDQVVEAIPALVGVRDQRGQFLRVNLAYETTYGLERAAVRGRSAHEALPAEIAEAVAAADDMSMLSSRALVYETRMAGAHGAVRSLLSRACALRNADGDCVGVITVDSADALDVVDVGFANASGNRRSILEDGRAR